MFGVWDEDGCGFSDFEGVGVGGDGVLEGAGVVVDLPGDVPGGCCGDLVVASGLVEVAAGW